MGPQGPWSWPYVENNKPVVTFFAKPDFSRFLICVINGSGVSFGQFANLFEFFLHHMTALPVYVCLGFQASYNFEYQKMSTCISPRPSPLKASENCKVFGVLKGESGTLAKYGYMYLFLTHYNRMW